MPRWISVKSDKKNKKLFQVSSKRDNFEYAVKSVAWELPENVKNAQGYAPVKLDVQAASLMEERFTILQDYLFNDEGEKVKVYITFPEPAVSSLSKKEAPRKSRHSLINLWDASDEYALPNEALEVSFEYQAFDLKWLGHAQGFHRRASKCFISPSNASYAACTHVDLFHTVACGVRLQNCH